MRHTDGYAMLEELSALGFNSVELSHGIRYSLWPGILKAHEEKLVQFSSLHNFCPLPLGFLKPAPNCYEFSDFKESMRKSAVKYTKHTIDCAAQLGATAVVLHSGSLPLKHTNDPLEHLAARGNLCSRRYVKHKLSAVLEHEEKFAVVWPRVKDCLLELLEYAAGKKVRLGLESRESVEEIPLENQWDKIFAELPDAGYWHDFGHSARKDCLGFIDHVAEFSRHAGRLIGCHVQDFTGPRRDHQPLGEGTVPFQQFWPHLKNKPVFVLELSPRVETEKVAACLNWWKQNGPKSPGV